MSKNQTFLFLVFFTLAFNSFAQSDSSGIYLSSADFQSRKLTYPCNCQKDKRSIKIGSFFNSHDITVTYAGEKHKLSKADIFGYKGCDKRTYRFYHENEYRVISTLKIYLYFREAETGTGKSASNEEHFYFSVSLDSDIIPLTTNNLKEAYPDNTRFHELLDSSFRSETELSMFDKYVKKYKLVMIFEESLKK